ncbi:MULTISPECIES: DUF427 domain-containing protein [Rhodovulum]|uniref:Uncharacterized protein (DUF427 family) n=2 Tax=Rhodovulum TaxID=34008 RepID=A0A8E3AQ67_9RHOB|nr:MULTISPECIES: DUF427 domain-containing protein [Rhodovulum]PTW44125.1 uncharacterized protein (DUF427 family) [Rhodovulum kholense]RAP40465.1 hypothetical protein BYZ73_15255 [Rhodovulum viride]
MVLLPEDVRAYPRPPALEPVGETLEVVFGGALVARTRRGLRVLETHHAPTYYFPPEDVAPGVLRPGAGRSFCEWKGRAAYFDLTAGGRTAPGAGWSYPDPTPAFAALRDHVAFYAGKVEACRVGGVAATPQPGGFYGGWVTPNLLGIVKGGPGTEGW